MLIELEINLVLVEVGGPMSNNLYAFSDQLSAVEGDIGQASYVLAQQAVDSGVQQRRKQQDQHIGRPHRRELVQDFFGLFRVVEQPLLPFGRHRFARGPHLLPQIARRFHTLAQYPYFLSYQVINLNFFRIFFFNIFSKFFVNSLTLIFLEFFFFFSEFFIFYFFQNFLLIH